MEKIDFVLLWVDGSDPAWREQKNQYSPKKVDYGTNDNRFRDWDNLQYWFRGVEKYAPWVNHVYFVTWGHLPKWLNADHPKLKIVKHTDFIPEEYLPTFNSDTIETNLFRLEDLSEHFVLFNDDFFLIDSVRPEDFFQNGLPCDSFVENLIAPVGRFGISHTKVVMTDIINAHFKKRAVHRKYWKKIYNPKYGMQNLITLYFEPFGYFTGFRNPHIAQSHLKSTFGEVWEKEPEALDTSCRNRFRGTNDVSHWLMRYWNLCSGEFEPRSIRFGRYFEAANDNKALCSYIREQRGKTICINDMSRNYHFETARDEINAALRDILPEKSAFEA
ncbi:MAG: Stealth CR1 domain-containing protein [Lachnospiraceae bacterium]|nr:Stealth CR1 domain-containing protein [Lachnospiraceae bacterium]